MKFVDWYNFNFVENKVMGRISVIYMKAMRKKSFLLDDKMLDTLAKDSDAARMFGDYELMSVDLDKRDDYTTICAIVYKEDN